jgi:hypothetical protein
VKIVDEHTLISCGKYVKSPSWKKVRRTLYKAIREVEWPPGSGSFTIYPESGKKRKKGNGVKPIKLGLMEELRSQGWIIEKKAKNKIGKQLGDYDAALETSTGPVVLEWETGNISSSHRSMNKMAMNLMHGIIAAGILVIPSRKLYKFLTDRIGNAQELEPYFHLWRSIPCKSGILEVVVIEHDAESFDVPKIPKGTDGRALQ